MIVSVTLFLAILFFLIGAYASLIVLSFLVRILAFLLIQFWGVIFRLK